jgi:hypothetical protein
MKLNQQAIYVKGENMKKIGLATIISIILFTTICNVKAQTPTTENMETFFDHEIPGIKIIVNATAETQPNDNITVRITMNPLLEVNIEYFNFSVFGFINGTYKTMIYNITDNFPLPYERNFTCPVPEQVWGVTYGEITLTYYVKYVIEQGNIKTETTITYENLTVGFDMTNVENVYLKKLENDLKSWIESYQQLNNTYWQLNSTFEQLQQNYTELQQNYTALRGNLNELGNTRTAVGILAITTVFFVATTLYLVMRKPKESW